MIRNNNKPMDEYFRIYTRKVALELRKRGFYICGTEPNERFPQYDVYLFKDSPAFRQTFYDLTHNK